MASKRQKASVPSQNKFAETLLKIGHRFSLPQVFDDFLTMVIAACTQNSQTKLSYYEDEYLQTIAKFKDSELRFEFPKAFAALVSEMEERVDDASGNDVLGAFFEEHISHGRNGEYFTPPHICQFMAILTQQQHTNDADPHIQKPLRILDSSCGSGRMLLAAHKVYGSGHEYYGIDINQTCVKMSALNLFLNGMWRSEVLCANALLPNDFVIAYRISFHPLGIFKIETKEESILWHLHQHSFEKELKPPEMNMKNQVSSTDTNHTDSTQLNLF